MGQFIIHTSYLIIRIFWEREFGTFWPSVPLAQSAEPKVIYSEHSCLRIILVEERQFPEIRLGRLD